MESLGMVELNSIAQGISTADAILKAANVHIVFSQPVCPGKYAIIISGSVADVRAAIDAGNDAGAINVLDTIVIPRIHEDVLSALNGCVDLKGVESLGIIETFTLAQALRCADEAVKSADVALMEIRLAAGLGGKSFVLLTGSISSVRAAVRVAVEACENEGMIAGTAVIPAPHPELADFIL